MLVDFHKMHGAGNDFVLLDARNGGVAAAGSAALAADPAAIVRLADRHRGIGFDQLVLVAAGDAPDEVRARFFNADGGESGACGNATRCVAVLAGHGENGRRVRVRTAAGILVARLLGRGRVEVDMGPPALDWREVPLARHCDTLRLPLPGEPAACSMGNPHATLFAGAGVGGAGFGGMELDPERDGAALERDPLFPERANIGFATMVDRERMRLRVWERGAGLTLACGSGACAAVVNAVRRGLGGRRITVEMPGGELVVEWRAGDGHVLLAGPAATSFTGRVALDGDPAAAGIASGTAAGAGA